MVWLVSWPFPSSKTRSPGRASPMAWAALAQAARIDRMIKGLAAGDVWNEFRRLGLDIAVA